MEQTRVPIDSLLSLIEEKVSLISLLKKLQ